MSYARGTQNYNLPQTQGTDKRDWSDTNAAFLAIDRDIKTALDTASSASSAASTAQTRADNAYSLASTANTAAGNAATAAATASELAQTAKNRADSAYTAAGNANTKATNGGIGQNSTTRVNGSSSATLLSLANSLFSSIDTSKVVFGRSYIHMHRSTEGRAFTIHQVSTGRIDCGAFMVNSSLAIILAADNQSSGQVWNSDGSVADYNPNMPSGSYLEIVY